MSDNEIDQIARDTGRMFRQILDVGHAYIARRRGVSRAGAVRRLSRDERRELAQQIRTEVDEQRIVQTWFTQRVEDYRRETIASRHRISRGADNDVESARLDAMRYSIESTMGGTVLSDVQRGQIVSAMDRCNSGHADRPFYRPELFRQSDGHEAVQLREAAARSQRWVTDRRAAVDRLLPDRGEAAAREAEFRTVDPERAERQAWAIQDLRHVEAVSREFGDTRRVRAWRSTAHDRARAAGLSAEQVKWEVANAEANSRVQVTVKAARDGSSRFSDYSWHGYFPEEAQAAAWTRDLAADHDWRPGTVLTAKARENGRDKPFYAIEGNQVEVARDAELWHSEARDGFTHTRQAEQTRGQTRTQQQVERTVEANPQPQQAEPQRPTEPQLHRQAEQPQQVPADELDRVRARRDRLEKQVSELVAERDALSVKLDELGKRLTAVERKSKRYQSERDEAVQKLAQARPRAERLGSQERIAAEQVAESGHVAEQVGVRIHNGHITVEQGHDSGHVAEQTREAASADGTSRVHITDSTVVAANIAGRGHVGSLNYSSATASGDAVARAKAQQRDLADQAGGSATASASASTSEQRGPEPSRPVNAFAAAAARESGHERGGFER